MIHTIRNETPLLLTDTERFLLGYLVHTISEAIFKDQGELGRNQIQLFLELNLSERADFEALRVKLRRSGPKAKVQ